MSIGIFDKKYQGIKPDLQIFEDSHILTNLSIPFSIMFKKNRTPDKFSEKKKKVEKNTYRFFLLRYFSFCIRKNLERNYLSLEKFYLTNQFDQYSLK